MKVIMQLSRIGTLFAGLVLAASASAQVKWDMYTFVGVTHPIAVRLIGFAEEVKKTNEWSAGYHSSSRW